VALGPRELDVLRLVAPGLSNAEITGQMFLSTATVKSHVAWMLAELDVRDHVSSSYSPMSRGSPSPAGRSLRYWEPGVTRPASYAVTTS
jgi:hypothetical protein